MQRRGAFDYILLETSGVADPGNIAPLFWVDEGLGSTIYLDGIVAVVDALNLGSSLAETGSNPHSLNASTGAGQPGNAAAAEEIVRPEYEALTTAHLQLGCADVVVVNKVDLVGEEQLGRVKERVAGINGLARVVEVSLKEGGRVELEGVLLDLRAYDSVEDVKGRMGGGDRGHPDPVSTALLTCCFRLNVRGLWCCWLAISMSITTPGDAGQTLHASRFTISTSMRRHNIPLRLETKISLQASPSSLLLNSFTFSSSPSAVTLHASPSRSRCQADKQQSISTVTFTFPVISASQLDLLEQWLRSVLWEAILPPASPSALTITNSAANQFSIHRLKGRIVLDSGETKMIQGVREVFEISAARDRTAPASSAGGRGDAGRGTEQDQEWGELEVEGKMVIIGKDVAGKQWSDSLRAYLQGGQ